MIKNCSRIFVVLLIFSLKIDCFGRELTNFNQFTKILGVLESSNNPEAYNKGENAIGIYQIRLLYFKDAQRFDLGLRKYSHSDCYSPEISKRVVKAYVANYVKSNSFEDFARCHNSGPNWKNKKHLTNKYVARFKQIEKKLSLVSTNK